ncbi:MAG: energy-coupled thiamine transporter ThiT [Clostridia bacterium]|nr:energy-coupled thiamine transporter ThiT [Clostridia bacterium]
MTQILDPLKEYLARLVEPKPLISLAALIALIIVLVLIRSKTSLSVKMLSYGAIAISAAFILSYVRIYKMPTGGTVTLASMLPIFIFAYIAGPRAGILAGMCYGLLQFIQDPFLVHPVQFILDYPLAFALLGLAGLIKDRLFIGAVIGCAGRFICHYLSGVVFFAEYANGQNVFIYSLAYNSSYLIPELIIILGILLVPNMKTAIKRVRAASY